MMSDTVPALALYVRPSCPYCVRVTEFCQQHQLSLEQRNIAEGSHLEALMVGGGKRQVPCLRIESASGEVRWLYESLDIIAYLKAHLVR
ncbi:glutaredoxin family protein [Pseudaeromonas sharmana]|uniref:Glutaredoxin family protein n=1 Tax=Pseudaeromonas sharmana TaxID=328412 RepID=A0ABV8CIZ8_9GAMM